MNMYYSKYMIPYYTFLISIFLADKKHVKCARNSREPPTVEIPGQGIIVGREVLVSRSKSQQFLGIPYAEPPVGELRFAPPKPAVASWSGVRNASEYGPACMQVKSQLHAQDRLLLNLLPEMEFSEDCLHLNVFVPDGQKPSDGWPVVVWLHPGNFSNGAASIWDGSTFAVRQKVLVVTVSYRLNLFGFFTTNDNAAPGNYGLLDQVAALEWVSDKISAFGGSRGNIVLWGHGGGGMSVGFHLVSPLSRGKFARAIMMSARSITSGAVKSESKMEIYKRELGKLFGCDPDSALMLICLRRPRADYLLEHASHLSNLFGPIIDESFANASRAFLPKDPDEYLRSNEVAQVPLLIGYNAMEDALDLLDELGNPDSGTSWSDLTALMTPAVAEDIPDPADNESCIHDIGESHLVDTVTFYYKPRPVTNLTINRDKYVDFRTEKYYGSVAYSLATSFSELKLPVYLYRFDYKIKTDNFIRFPMNNPQLSSWVTAPHQFELPFVWGMPYWTHMKRNITWNSADKKMSDLMLSLWGNFIKYGNPTQSGVNVKWDLFDTDIPGIMILDRNSNMSDASTLDYKAFTFWNEYYPKVLEVLETSCNSTASSIFPAPVSPKAMMHFPSVFITLLAAIWCSLRH